MKRAKGTRVVNLTVMQRMNLVRMLPPKGETILTVKAIVNLQDLLNLSGEEIQELGLDKAASGNLQLTEEQQAATRELEINGTAWGIIRDSIRDIEKAGNLPATPIMVELWEIFMEAEPVLVEESGAELEEDTE